MKKQYKNLVLLICCIGLSAGAGAAYAKYNGTAEKGNKFSIVSGEQDGSNVGRIVEPDFDEAVANSGLMPKQIIDKNPYIQSDIDYEAWAFMKVEVPLENEVENIKLLNVNKDDTWYLIRDTYSKDKRTLIYGYKDKLAARGKTTELFDSFEILDTNNRENEFIGDIEVTGLLIQTEGTNDIKDASDKLDIDNKFSIRYILNGGSLEGQKTEYTKDDYGYTPPEPTKNGYIFNGWNPSSIAEGSTGSITFEAQWDKKTVETTLLAGADFNNKLKSLAGSLSNITSIEKSDTKIDDNGVEISIAGADAPVYAWYDNGVIKYWTEADKVYLNANCKDMFDSLSKVTNIDIADWDSSNVTNMESLYYGCSSIENIDLSVWEKAHPKSLMLAFCNCYKLTNVDLSKLDLSNCTSLDRLCMNDRKLTSLILNGCDTSKVTEFNAIASGCTILEKLDLSELSFESCETITSICDDCRNIESVDFGDKVISIQRGQYAFRNCYKLTSLNAHIDTSNATNLTYMYYECRVLEDIDTSMLDTSNVTGSGLDYTFSGCHLLKSINTSKIKTDKLTSLNGTFDRCNTLTVLDVNHFNTSGITSARETFSYCYGLTSLDITNWNTSNIKDISEIFNCMYGITELDLSNFDISSLTKYNNAIYALKPGYTLNIKCSDAFKTILESIEKGNLSVTYNQ